MRNLFKFVSLAALVFGAYTVYDGFLGSGARALEGNWRSNKEASLQEAARNGASEGQQALLARLYVRSDATGAYEVFDKL